MTDQAPVNGLKYYSMLESSGYGLAALAYILGLIDAGVRLHWAPFLAAEIGYQPWPRVNRSGARVRSLLTECLHDKEDIERLIRCLKPLKQYDTVLMHTVPEYWPFLIEPDKHHIGYMAWETTRLPDHMPPLINQLDAVIVPAHFNQEIFRRSGVNIPIKVVPHILHQPPHAAQLIKLDLKQQLDIQDSDFVFYTINEWSARKAIWALLRAYLDSFSASDPVLLVVKTSARGPACESDPNLHDTRELLAHIVAEYENPARVKIINEKIDHEQVAALHALGDCFASTCHAEGWGLGVFEAAGQGNPVMITNWGGQLDYLPPTLANLIPCKMVPLVDKRGESSYGSDQQWAEPGHEATRSFLREIYQQREVQRTQAKILQAQLQQDYSTRVISQQLIHALSK